MWNSSRKCLPTVVVISLLILTGCWSPDKSGVSDSQSNANFYVSKAEFKGVSNSNSSKTIRNKLGTSGVDNHKLWKLNFNRQFSFNVCLKERGAAQKIAGQVFHILNDRGNTVSKGTTDDEGCLPWTESFYYNVLAPSKYLKMKRTVVSKKLYRGSFSFHIVLNPWLGRVREDSEGIAPHTIVPRLNGEIPSGQDELASTDYEVLTDPAIIQKALAGTYDIQPERDGQLYLSSFKYGLDKMDSKVQTEFFLKLKSGQLYTKVRKADGDYVEFPLGQGGVYAVMVRILQDSKTTNREILPLSLYNPHFSTRNDIDLKSEKKLRVEVPKFYINNAQDNNDEYPFPFHNFSVNSELKGNIPLQINNWRKNKKFMLLMTVAPENFPFPGFLKPMKSVFGGNAFSGGEANFLTSNEHSFFKKRGLIDQKVSLFDEYMDMNKNLSNPNESLVFHDFSTTNTQQNFVDNLKGESLTNRGIRYSATSCLTQKNGDVAPEGQKFEVTVRNGTKNADLNFVEVGYDNDSASVKPIKKTVVRTADVRGCITWNDNIWFRHFAPEEYIQIIAEIKEVGSDHHIEVKYRVNPWDEGWTFGKDERETEPKFLAEIRDQKKVSSRIFLPQFGYQTLRFKYKIDKYLNLIVSKQVLFDFAASTLRYNSNRQGRFGVYHLRDGIYLLKAAMEKNYLDPTTKGIWVRNPPSEECSDEELVGVLGGETVLKKPKKCLSTSKFISCPKGTDNCDTEMKSYIEDPFLSNEARSDIRMRRHLDVYSGLVRVVGGKIITPVAFEVKDLRVMRLRSNLFIQIDPVNEWALWMAKLYSQFYDELYHNKYKNMADQQGMKESDRPKNYFMDDNFQKEKAANIKKILEKFKGDPRFAHRKLVEKQQRERQSTLVEGGVQSNEEMIIFHKDKREYRICEAPDNAKVNWEEVLDAFELTDVDHRFLLERIGGSIRGAAFDHLDKMGYYNAFVNKKGDRRFDLSGKEQADTSPCLFTHNVIRPLLVNDHSDTDLASINRVNTSDFIDKESGLEQTTFFGPMTYLANGNRSNMRPTKNIAEYVCPSDDCDEHKSKEQLERALELAMDEYSSNPLYLEDFYDSKANSAGYEMIENEAGKKERVKKPFKYSDNFILNYLNSTTNNYETSPHFGSLSYANNLLVYDYSSPEAINSRESGQMADGKPLDLESQMLRLKELEQKENEIRSKLFYYLNNFNLDFVTLGDEKVMMYSPEECPRLDDKSILLANLKDESQCFVRPPGDGHINQEIQAELTETGNIKNDVKDMIQALRISEVLAQKICTHQLKRFKDIDFNILPPEEKEQPPTTEKVLVESENKEETEMVSQRLSRKARRDLRKQNSEVEMAEPTLAIQTESIATTDGKEPVKSIPKLIDVCVKDLTHQVNIDPVREYDIIRGHILDVERKVRVKQTGSYAFKGGKALNINISDQVSMGYNESYSFSIGKGLSIPDLKKMVLGWLDEIPGVKNFTRWPGDVFAMALNMVFGDRKWNDSNSNSKGEGNSISQGTFLVMQNASLDVELTDYTQCVTVTFSEKFMDSIGVHTKKFAEQGKPEPMLQSIAKAHEVSQSEIKRSAKEVKDLYMKGLMICDQSESKKAKTLEGYARKVLPIRENFYYLTQHFTEGDMLDSGDLANHPWLKAIRGKTDMWRFLAKIRNQDVTLRSDEREIPYLHEIDGLLPGGVELESAFQYALGNKVPFTDMTLPGVDPDNIGFQKTRGSMHIADEWPIYQLIKAYHGSIPSFPGVYSAINSPCNYNLDFPWGDQAADSFAARVEVDFSDISEENQILIRDSIEKMHRSSFPQQAKDEAPATVYMNDEQIEEAGMAYLKRVSEENENFQIMTDKLPIGLYTSAVKTVGGFDEQTKTWTPLRLKNTETGEYYKQPKKKYRINDCHGYRR